jgi:hypothetical protein
MQPAGARPAGMRDRGTARVYAIVNVHGAANGGRTMDRMC